MRNRNLILFCKKNLPTICTIGSILFGGAALFFTGKATVKAVRKYDELKEEGVEITPKVIVKQFVPYYIPAIGFASTSLALNITGNTVHANRNRVLSLAATSAVETLRDFKAKSVEVLGEDKVKEVEIAQAQEAPLLEAKTDSIDTPIIVYDVDEEIKIKTTYKQLYEAEAEVNHQLSDSSWTSHRISLKKFYRLLGMEEKRIPEISNKFTYKWNKVWDANYTIEENETNWIAFYHEEVYDKDGNKIVMLRYNPSPEYEQVIDFD